MSQIKAIAIDIDGTLLDSRARLTPRTIEAIRAASSQGVKVMLATGRARARKTLAILESLDLHTPGVFLQGLLVYDAHGGILRRRVLGRETVAQVLGVVDRCGYQAVAYCGDAAYASDRNYHTETVLRNDECDLRIVPALSALDPSTINKFVLFDEEARIEAIRAKLHDALGPAVHLTRSMAGSIEILPAGVSKAEALRWLLVRLHLTPDELMTLGDGENDRDLVAMAGFGVAMANGDPATRAAARFVTTSNDEDGVALAIERFVLA